MADEMAKANKVKFSEIKIGREFSFERRITAEDVLSFARLTGDFNPLHTDSEFAKKSGFGGNLVHGMLAGSLFSTLIGMHCPGENALYLSQTLKFKLPILCGDVVMVRGIVTDKSESVRVVNIRTEILKQGKVAVEGEAKIKVMGDA